MEQPKWKNWGDHPVFVTISMIALLIGIVAALIAVIVFLTGKQDLPSLLSAGTPVLTSDSSVSERVNPSESEVTLESLIATQSALETQTPTESSPGNFEIGRSVLGRPIEVERIGNGDQNVIFIGGLHAGFAPSTTEIAEVSASYFRNHLEEVPASVTLHIVLSANPDSPLDPGKLAGRLNANDVDLNRNWDCEWQKDARWQNLVIPNSGGTSPYSELETRTLLNYINEQQPVAVIFWEARHNDGLVSMGKCNGETRVSDSLATTYGRAAGYNVADFQQDTGQILNGDGTSSLDAYGIPAISVLLTDYEIVTDWEEHLQGIKAVLQMFANS